METPPPLPGKKPLGRIFYVLLIGPLAVMGMAVLMKSAGDASTRDLSIPLSFLAMLAMAVCSILCAIIVGKRQKNGWLGVLTFFGIQVVYLSAVFAGCDYISRGMSFH